MFLSRRVFDMNKTRPEGQIAHNKKKDSHYEHDIPFAVFAQFQIV